MGEKNVSLKRVVIGVSGIFVVIYVIVFIITLSKFNSDTIRLKFMVDEANQKGLNLMDESKYKEALDCFKTALEYAEEYDKIKESDLEIQTSISLFDQVYNNLCYAYYRLEDYKLSLEYGEKAMEKMPNDYYEYINLGNTLLDLGRIDEALTNYDLAIKDNKEAKSAYYGRGIIYFDKGAYDNALKDFELYLTYEPYNSDVSWYVISCNLYLDRIDEALDLVDKELMINDDIELHRLKGEIISKKSFEEAEEYYLNTIAKFPNLFDIRMLPGELYYNNGKYQQALDYFLDLTSEFPSNGKTDPWIIYSYEQLEDMEGLIGYVKKREQIGETSYELYNSTGDVLINQSRYMEAIPYLDMAIKAAPDMEEAYINKLCGLYWGKRYNRCIEFGLEASKIFEKNFDILGYIGNCYYSLYEFEQAILYYKQALEAQPENEMMLETIGYAYLLQEDYTTAKQQADQILTINPDNYSAKEILDTIRRRQEPIGEQLKSFIHDNYLYYEDDPGIKERIDRLISKGDLTNGEIVSIIEQIKLPEDIFTFVISGDEYDFLNDMNYEDVEYQTIEDICYLRIYGFNINTDNRVIELLDKIEETESKTLVIDLRSNSGGLADCANHILDILLPEYVASTMIDREGYTTSYYSDASQTKFNKIYVLIDEYSASASELVTLGLKTYLNNVTILGRNSFGKGVGQTVYEDKKRKLMIYLVNSFWNVRQQNIMDTNIAPDIYVDSDYLEDYIKIIKDNR